MHIHKFNNLLNPKHNIVELKQFSVQAKQLYSQSNNFSTFLYAEDFLNLWAGCKSLYKV